MNDEQKQERITEIEGELADLLAGAHGDLSLEELVGRANMVNALSSERYRLISQLNRSEDTPTKYL